MSDVPEVVKEALEVIGDNPQLKGATLEALETAPGTWEISASFKVCCACARRIGKPTGEQTIANPGQWDDGDPIIMPHVCPECAGAVAAENERAKESN